MARNRASLLASGAVLALLAGLITAQDQTPEPEQPVELRELDRQVVLYTIYRGDYAGVGAAIGRLFQTAGQNGVMPRGNVALAYLNNPRLVGKEHWLTEVRIPVGDDALKLAGTLGELTDVKELPAMQAVVAVKPVGVADAESLIDRMAAWCAQNGYTAMDAHYEVFLGQGMTSDYAQMKSELYLPVRPLPTAAD